MIGIGTRVRYVPLAERGKPDATNLDGWLGEAEGVATDVHHPKPGRDGDPAWSYPGERMLYVRWDAGAHQHADGWTWESTLAEITADEPVLAG